MDEKKKQTLKLKPTYASEPNCTLNYNVIILGEKIELILVTFKPIEKCSLKIKVIIAKHIERNLEVSLLVVVLI